MKIGVILPVEERFDPVEGGAIARWVASVYPHLPYETTIFAAPPLKGEGYAMRHWSSIIFSFLDRLATWLSERVSQLSNRDPVDLRAKLFLFGFLYLLVVFPAARKSDLLHIHNRPTYVAWLRKLGFKGKIVLHMHNSLDPSRRSHRLDYLQAADLILFCSRHLLATADRDYQGHLPPSEVVYNGIPALPLPNTLASRKPFQLVTAGRLVPEKGAMEAIEIVRRLHARGLPVELKIVGSFFFGSEFKSPYVRSLERAAEMACTEAHSRLVELTGQLSHDDLLDLFGKSSIFLYPCQWEEPFGMVIAEAMACGTPPVASDTGGIAEVVGPNFAETLLQERTDIEAFANVCYDLLTNKEHWQAVAEGVRTHANAEFSWRRIALRLQSIIERT